MGGEIQPNSRQVKSNVKNKDLTPIFPFSTKKVAAVVNGTAALHIALKLAGVESGDEVLTPALTFVATANAVAYCSAIPHFVDSEESTLGLDPHKLKVYLKDIARAGSDSCCNKLTGRRIKAVIPMHTFGHPVDLDPKTFA